MDLPGCVMDDWWNHHGVSVLEVRYLRGYGSTWVCDWWDHKGVTSYCGLFNQQVNYLKGCVCQGMVWLVKSPWCDYILGIVRPRGEMFCSGV